MRTAVENARLEADSVGGTLEVAAVGMPAGIGSPMFDGIENRLAPLLFGIPAVKGVSFGEGFGFASMRGSQANDPFTYAEDGSRQYTDTVMNSELGAINYLRSQGIQYRIGMKQDAGYEYATMNEAGTAATELYSEYPEWFRLEEPPYLDGALDMKYPPELEDEYEKLMANIRPYVDEKFQSWLLGTGDFESEYDDFVAELKARGIDRDIEINQIAYDTYIENANQ